MKLTEDCLCVGDARGGLGLESVVWRDLLDKVENGLPVCSDSRQVTPGSVFVALPGIQGNGYDYIPDALKRGAGFIVAAREPACSISSGVCFLKHSQPRLALGELAQAYFKPRLKVPLIGVTGTNGKSTVCSLLEHIFTANGLKVGVLGTISYRWPGREIPAPLTTPGCWDLHGYLSQMAEAGVDVVCMEVSSHGLSQDRVAGLEFDQGVFTNLSLDHLDYHQDLEDYFLCKQRLFLGQPYSARKQVVNLDDTYGLRLIREIGPSVLGFGVGRGQEETEGHLVVRGQILGLDRGGVNLLVHCEKRSWEIVAPVLGRHNVYNLLAAIGVVLNHGLSPEETKVLASFPGVPGRLEQVANSEGLNIFVDYAHTPDALEKVLASVRELDFQNLLVVFGCGGDRDRSKRPLMGKAVARYADLAVVTSDNPRHEDPLEIIQDILPGLNAKTRVVVEADRRKAIALAISELGPEDVLVIAGKGHEQYQQVGDEKRPFSDYLVVQEFLG